MRNRCLALIWAMVCGMSLMISLPVSAQEEDEAVAEEEGAPAVAKSMYFDLKPDFVVNYGGVGKLRYLKASVSLRVSGGTEGPGNVRHHMPHIRHALVMCLSNASEENLASMTGRELLRQNALQAVRDVLLREEGVQHIDDLLFSAFIVQR